MCDVTMQGRHVGSGDSKGMFCMKPTSSLTTSFRRFVWNSTRQSDVKKSNSRLLSTSTDFVTCDQASLFFFAAKIKGRLIAGYCGDNV